MGRCAVLIDAGYLLGAAATILTKADRGSLIIDYPALITAIVAEAEQQSGMDVLRVLWYDAAKDAFPTPEHRTLSQLPDVKVRLGLLVRRGEQMEQKGVDSFLQRDLTTLARNRAVEDIVLVGGDEDLRRGVEEAQDYGVRVRMWGVEAAETQYNQSRQLIAEADRRWLISSSWISRFVASKDVPEVVHQVEVNQPVAVTAGKEPVAAALDLPPAPTQVIRTASPVIRPPRQPSEIVDAAAVQRLINHNRLHGLSVLGPRPTAEPEQGSDISRLKDLSTGGQSWRDNEDDTTSSALIAAEVGDRYGRRWVERATAEQRAALAALYPIFPRQIDAELLKYAVSMSIPTWDDDPAKFAVRAAVWDVVRIADDE